MDDLTISGESTADPNECCGQYGKCAPWCENASTDSGIIDPVSYAPEVFVDGKWTGNGLRFATYREADLWANDLLMRWFVPSDARAVTSTDPVTSVIDAGGNYSSINR